MPISYMASNGNGHYLQKRVPKDLASAYPKPVIKRYLSTDLAEAKQKLPVELARLEQEFAEKRRWRDSKPLATLSEIEIERLTAIWLHDVMLEDEDARREGLDDSMDREEPGLTEREFEKMADNHFVGDVWKASLARGSTAVIAHEVEELLVKEGVKLDKQSEAYRRLSMAVLKAAVRAADMIVQRHKGEVVDTPTAPNRFTVSATAQDEDGDRLSVVYEKWKLERKPPDKTAKDFYAFVRRFIELHGDMPVTKITRRHVVVFKEAMLQFPARPSGPLAKMTVPQILEAVSKDTAIPRLAQTTVNDKALGAISAVLGFAVSNAMIESNPASLVKVAMGEVQKDGRLSYALEHLNTIFRFPIFVGKDRPIGGGGEAAKWLPLLALFTGARLEELGQCTVSDCKEEAGIPFLDLTVVEDGKKRKRNSARRRVPIHPELVRLGFLAYVKDRRKAGDKRLFPHLKSERSHITSAWSQWWGRYARKHGITDKRLVFHSFRHSFKDAGRAALLSVPILHALQGHSSGGGEGDNYGSEGYPLSVLANELAKLQYIGLDLTHLYPAKSRKG